MTGFPKWGRLVGGQFRENGKKLYENYKMKHFKKDSSTYLIETFKKRPQHLFN